jgi:hypothetical protein
MTYWLPEFIAGVTLIALILAVVATDEPEDEEEFKWLTRKCGLTPEEARRLMELSRRED